MIRVQTRHLNRLKIGPCRWLPFGLLAALGACSNDSNKTRPDDGGASGGDSGSGSFSGSGAIESFSMVAAELSSPSDAVPGRDSSGQIGCYYIALSDTGDEEEGMVGSLYFADTKGGAPRELVTGFEGPFGVVLSPDQSTAFVADTGVSGAPTGSTETAGGAVYSVSISGGTKQMLGAAGYQPRSLEVIADGTLYFSGNDPNDGQPGIFSLSGRGTVAAVKKGAPLDDPSGVAARRDGSEIYLVDSAGGQDGTAVIYRLSGGNVEVFVDGLQTGYPAGAALSADEKFLLVSGLSAAGGTALIHRINLADKSVEVIRKKDATENAAGGVHRLYDGDKYCWSYPAPIGGGVFFLE